MTLPPQLAYEPAAAAVFNAPLPDGALVPWWFLPLLLRSGPLLLGIQPPDG